METLLSCGVPHERALPSGPGSRPSGETPERLWKEGEIKLMPNYVDIFSWWATRKCKEAGGIDETSSFYCPVEESEEI